MRILHVSTRLILGGSQENTVLSCEEQARRGHEVHLAFGPIYGPEGSMLERVEAFNRSCESGGNGRVKPIGLHLIRNLVREIAPVKDWLCYHELKSTVREIAPNVVQTHSSKAGILGRLAGWAISEENTKRGTAGLPRVVHTIHGPPWQAGEAAWREWVYVRSERLAAKKCHAIVSVADAMTEQFLARGIGTPGLYRTVRSGMEVAPFLRSAETRDAERAAMGFAPGDTVIGTVARLADLKGHDDVLDAMAGVIGQAVGDRAGGAGSRVKLLWVGDGWKREALIAKARAMGLRVREMDRAGAGSGGAAANADQSADVVLTGLVPPERIPALMGAMDVLAHASRREGLPRTVPQALLAGVCPVATDADGTREVCVEMQTGRLVPVGDVAALRSALLWCVEHPEARRELAERGRERCAKEFTVGAMVDGLEAVYAGRE